MPDGSYRTVVGNQTVAIHPSSVLFGKKVEAIMYNEYVFTNRSYARGVSAVQMDWVGEALAGQSPPFSFSTLFSSFMRAFVQLSPLDILPV